jgi:multidrug efflux pump subunit AcrA (membrane-fusion protein)
VDEFVPSADPVSRSFRVRVALPEIENLYPGMFARMRLPVGQRRAVTVPAESVTAVGQLRTVVVEEDGRWERRYVTAGETRDGSTEILSGLSGGETVGIPES